jgi:antitoxin (DNA-binding transcriptional repressor) of toxin-antitoxin stability system
MQVSVPVTKEELLELIDAALKGEEVIISPADRGPIKLVPVSKGKFKHGILEGKLTGEVPDFLESMSEEELRLWEGS